MKYIIEVSNNTHEAGIALARRLGKEAIGKEVFLEYDKNGKPRIKDSSLCVSISHSGNFVIAGINPKPIGVDIEIIKDYNKKLINRFFSQEEKTFIKTDEDFFRVWTVKEAYSKLTGEGLKGMSKLSTVKDGSFYIDGCEIFSFIENSYAVAIVYEK